MKNYNMYFTPKILLKGRSEINTIDVLSALQLLDSQLFQIMGYGNLLEEPFLTRLPKSFEIRRRPKVSYFN
jgi:hypothetical protein